MIAFHYPPYKGGSGVHRTLKFSRYLPQHAWQPIVLSANIKAYPHVGNEQLADVPEGVLVKRAFALDTSRHLAVAGRYLRFLALPDQWVSWWMSAVIAGLRLIRQHRPTILWSTYPIATAHLIGLTLQRLTGLPWVADLRDSMTEDSYPRDYWQRRSYVWIEKNVVRYAARIIFTAPSTREMYHCRYPRLKGECSLLIPNGYDEDDFVDICSSAASYHQNCRPVRLVHAGLIYPDDRDPKPFFRTLSSLKSNGTLGATKLKVDLRAPGSEHYYERLIAELQISDIVRLLPALPYRQSLQDCANADGLLLFQAASCNHQIPAKAYEYLRLGKPILALTPIDSDTGALLAEGKGATIIDLADEKAMFDGIPKFVASLADRSHSRPDASYVARYSRRNQTSQLATIFDELSMGQ
jgi:glycosyltransferase involved in cell wall biosynthesis